MPFGVLSGVPDVITHAKFCVNRLRGFSVAAPPKVPFPILFRTTLTTVLHYRADCDEVSLLRLSHGVVVTHVFNIVVIREFSDNHACIMIRTGSATCWYVLCCSSEKVACGGRLQAYQGSVCIASIPSYTVPLLALTKAIGYW